MLGEIGWAPDMAEARSLGLAAFKAQLAGYVLEEERLKRATLGEEREQHSEAAGVRDGLGENDDADNTHAGRVVLPLPTRAGLVPLHEQPQITRSIPSPLPLPIPAEACTAKTLGHPATQPASKLEEIGLSFYGYDKVSCKYAMRYDGHEKIVWKSESELEGIDLRWLEMSRQQGLPSKDQHTSKFRPLVLGLAVSYVNLCQHLNCITPPLEEIVTLSEPQLKQKISIGGYPCRLGRSKLLTGAPRQPGAYLVWLSGCIVDGLCVLPCGGLRFFPNSAVLAILCTHHCA